MKNIIKTVILVAILIFTGCFNDSMEDITGWIPKDATVPDATVPDTTVPDTTVPDTTVPDATVPDTTVPDATVPDATVPDTTVPDTTVPDTTVPDATVPDATVPDTTVPDTTVPDTTVPDTTVPDTVVPDITVPDSKNDNMEEQQPVDEEKIYPIAQNVLVIGNSITLGFGTHGMASSAVDTDYYSLLHEYMLQQNSELKMKRIAGYGWEGSITSEDRLFFLEKSVLPELSEKCDLIIIQLGDNVNTAEKLETFSVDAEKILEWFREKRPDARILWVFGRYNLNNGPIIQAACEKYDVEYVDISIISKDDRYKAKLNDQYEKSDGSVGIITDAGVASHPNDEGMRVISEIIIMHLGYERE